MDPNRVKLDPMLDVEQFVSILVQRGCHDPEFVINLLAVFHGSDVSLKLALCFFRQRVGLFFQDAKRRNDVGTSEPLRATSLAWLTSLDVDAEQYGQVVRYSILVGPATLVEERDPVSTAQDL